MGCRTKAPRRRGVNARKRPVSKAKLISLNKARLAMVQMRKAARQLKKEMGVDHTDTLQLETYTCSRHSFLDSNNGSRKRKQALNARKEFPDEVNGNIRDVNDNGLAFNAHSTDTGGISSSTLQGNHSQQCHICVKEMESRRILDNDEIDWKPSEELNVKEKSDGDRNAFFCLLCSKETQTTPSSKYLNDSVDGTEADFLVLFILKKMLNVPNEHLENFLSVLGHPRDWISACDNCSPLIADAFQVQKKICELELVLRRCQIEIKGKILKTFEDSFDNGFPVVSNVPLIAATENTRHFVATGEWPTRKPSSDNRDLTEQGATVQQQKTIPVTVLQKPVRVNPVPVLKKPARVNPVPVFEKPARVNPVPVLQKAVRIKPVPVLQKSVSIPILRKAVRIFPVPIPQDNSEKSPQNYSDDDACYGNNDNEPSIIQQSETISKDTDDVLLDNGNDKPSWYPTESVGKMVEDYVSKNPTLEIKKFTRDGLTDSTEPVYSCAMCPNLKSMQINSFVKHLVFHHDRPYKCSTCNAYSSGTEIELSARSVDQNDNHYHVCTKQTLVKMKLETDSIWECGYCSSTFKLEGQRNAHEKEIHPKEKPVTVSHSCSRCSNTFRDYFEWQIHRALEHPDLAKLGCLYCDEIFRVQTKENIDVEDVMGRIKHIRNEHNTYIYCSNLLDCYICGENFDARIKLQDHMEENHHISDKNLFAFMCPICFKTNRGGRYDLEKHIYRVHQIRSREKYICDLCPYYTVVPPLFLEHKLLKHGTEPEDGRQLKTCSKDDCSFKCVMQKTMDVHNMKEHGAERKFKCNVCGKGFLNANKHQAHMQIHLNSKSKPFQCEICGNSFAVQNYLYIHKRLSHQNRPFASTHKKKPSRKRKITYNQNTTQSCDSQQSQHSVPLLSPASLEQNGPDHAPSSTPS